MNYVLFDSDTRPNLLPFTHTRPVADIRCGIMTMRERWDLLLGSTTATLTQAHIQPMFSTPAFGDNTYINGAVFADRQLAAAVAQLPLGNTLAKDNVIIAARPDSFNGDVSELNSHITGMPAIQYAGDIYSLKYVWDIFSLCDRALRDDFALVTAGKRSAWIPEHVIVKGKENLFIEDGGKIQPGCIINAEKGPVYIGKGAELLEGTMVHGPLAMCSGSVTKMGAKVYGATTIGPGCKVGGELSNVVFFANSNKAHDGYLGNAVIGEWCNLGADTNCSNLKNNYGTISIWHEATATNVSTGLIFCGLIMGDHSKCGINTMFNTGTVVGVSCNIYGADFLHKHIPSFSWGSSEKMIQYDFRKAMETADRMMERRGRKMPDEERAMLKHVFDNRPSR